MGFDYPKSSWERDMVLIRSMRLECYYITEISDNAWLQGTTAIVRAAFTPSGKRLEGQFGVFDEAKVCDILTLGRRM